ncbi:MAG: hypothetical protein CMH54_04225 [Myxococcales bacterium]|nr:hypothetical protein [Myxococcales bacterium]
MESDPISGQGASRSFNYWLMAATALTFVMALFRFDGPAKGYWDTYITAPAMFMTGNPATFVRDGQPPQTAELRGVLPDDLKSEACGKPCAPDENCIRSGDENRCAPRVAAGCGCNDAVETCVQMEGQSRCVARAPPSYGIITKDQRVGGGITASVFFLFFGVLGFRILFALCLALIVPLTVLVIRRLDGVSDWIGLAAGLALAWNPFMLSVDRLNANLFVVPLILMLLELCFRPRVPWIWVGVVLGLIAGLRNAGICFVPALFYWAMTVDSPTDWRERIRRLVSIASGTLLLLLPIFAWKFYAYGDPFIHPSQYAHYQGFRPEFAHSLFGIDFRFNGLFNWPLHDSLVRTPHFAFPTYMLFPLVIIRSFGIVLTGLMILGLVSLWRDDRKRCAFLLLWIGVVYILFGPQENWEEVKMTFALLMFPIWTIFLAVGLRWAWRPWDRRRVIAFAVTCCSVFAVVRAARYVRVPADHRWYQRFPNADMERNPDAHAGLAANKRNDAIYFESYETPSEIARERRKLTAGYLWPAPYLPLSWDLRREGGEMGSEYGQRSLEILAVWDDIYDQREDP